MDYVYLSTDSGVSWTNGNVGLPGDNYGYVSSFVVNGSNLFAGTYELGGHGYGIFLSTDSGTTWIPENTGFRSEGLVFSLTVNGSELFAGTDSGVWRRSLSDFGVSAVSPVASTENSLTSYPNPFSQSTTINFTTPESGVVTVAIVNILGATVARIFSGELGAGAHSFTWDANGLPAGMYECIIQMNGRVERTAVVVN